METYNGNKLPIEELDLFEELEKMVELLEGFGNNTKKMEVEDND